MKPLITRPRVSTFSTLELTPCLTAPTNSNLLWTSQDHSDLHSMPKLVSRSMIRKTDYGDRFLLLKMSQLLSKAHQKVKLALRFTTKLWELPLEFQETDQSLWVQASCRRTKRLTQFLQRTTTHGYTTSPTRTCLHILSGKLWMMDHQQPWPNIRNIRTLSSLETRKWMKRFTISSATIPLVSTKRSTIRSITTIIIRRLLPFPRTSISMAPRLRTWPIEAWMRKSGVLLTKRSLALMVKRELHLLQKRMVPWVVGTTLKRSITESTTRTQKNKRPDVAERGMDEEVHGFVTDSLPPLNTSVRSTAPFVPNGSDPSSHDGVAFIAKRPDVAERGMDEEVHGFVVDSLPPLNTRVRSTLPFVPNGSDPSAHSPAGYSAAERKHHHKHHQRDIAERGMDEEVHGFCTDSLPPLNTRLRSKLPFLPNGSDASAPSPSGEPYSAA